MPIGVNLSPGKWNSRLYKQSSPTVTNENSRVLKPAQAGASLCSCGLNRQANFKLTPMVIELTLQAELQRNS